jgi:hypothetical protein
MAKEAKRKSSVKKVKKPIFTPEQEAERKYDIRLRKVKSTIITAIKSHVAINSNVFTDYSNWYCGITKHKDAMIRIKRHMKDKKTPALYPIVRNALTRDNGNLVERHFSDLGMTNAPHKGGAKIESIYVYAFKRYPNLIEDLKLLLS